MAGWDEFGGLNRGYVLELYERFRNDPATVDPERPASEEPGPIAESAIGVKRAVGAVNLAQSIRRYGHLAAQLDPLGSKPPGDPSLLPETPGVTDDDLRRLPADLVPSPLSDRSSNMSDLVEAFRRVYCSTTGYD